MTTDDSSLSSLTSDSRSRKSLRGLLAEWLVPDLPRGRLQIVLPTGERIVRTGNAAGPEADLVVHRWRALSRMLRDGDHGFADGYLAGDWSTSDLHGLLAFCLQNEDALARRSNGTAFTALRNRLRHARNANTRRGSRRNIVAHYDLGNAFYRQWLDAGMTYSSALFRSSEQSLEEAQEAKLARICELLDLSEDKHVLEIGCGWGGLAERMLRTHGSSVTGITLSSDQLAHTRERLAPEAHSGRARFALQDYRDVSGRYDRIVSIEMIEAVGEQYWPTYFTKLRDALVDGGSVVLQAITIEERRFEAYRARPDFIQRYIFPGGMLLTKALLAEHAARAGLVLLHQECFGASYATTLRRWRERFLRAWPDIEPLGFDHPFRRMWEYYLAYCEVGFDIGAIDVGLFKLARR